MILRVLRSLAGAAVGVWLGAIILIAIVAQTTFATMPATGVDKPNTVAGQIMARNFAKFDIVQMTCGGILVIWQMLHAAKHKISHRDAFRAALTLAACGLMLYSACVMTPRITNMQPLLQSADPEGAVKAAFASFHATAVRLSQAVMLLVAAIAFEMAWPARSAEKP